MPADEADRLLVKQIRAGDQTAWQDLISRFEGRLLAFVISRLRNRSTAEDVVQEAFMGFLISLPNYDDRTPLETYLFSITAHKLTDVLRREGRRPTIPLLTTESGAGTFEIRGNDQPASALLRSHERKGHEENVIADCLSELVVKWKAAGEFERLQTIELLLVLGWANKVVAQRLGITEQAVANHKHYAVSKLKDAAARASLQGVQFEDFRIE
jgi:RNA polymerase sigma-70 factor (ECF subfamily)